MAGWSDAQVAALLSENTRLKREAERWKALAEQNRQMLLDMIQILDEANARSAKVGERVLAELGG